MDVEQTAEMMTVTTDTATYRIRAEPHGSRYDCVVEKRVGPPDPEAPQSWEFEYRTRDVGSSHLTAADAVQWGRDRMIAALGFDVSTAEHAQELVAVLREVAGRVGVDASGWSFKRVYGFWVLTAPEQGAVGAWHTLALARVGLNAMLEAFRQVVRSRPGPDA